MVLKKDINSILNKPGVDSIIESAVYVAVNNLLIFPLPSGYSVTNPVGIETLTIHSAAQAR